MTPNPQGLQHAWNSALSAFLNSSVPYVYCDFTTQPFISGSAQWCPLLSTLVSLRQPMTNSTQRQEKHEESRGLQRDSLPTVLLMEGSYHLERLHGQQLAFSNISIVTELCSVYTYTYFRHELTAGGTCFLTEHSLQLQGDSSQEAACMGCPAREGKLGAEGDSKGGW